jgi:hypothetical protein
VADKRQMGRLRLAMRVNVELLLGSEREGKKHNVYGELVYVATP